MQLSSFLEEQSHPCSIELSLPKHLHSFKIVEPEYKNIFLLWQLTVFLINKEKSDMHISCIKNVG